MRTSPLLILTALTDTDAILERMSARHRLGHAWDEEALLIGDMGLAAPIVNSQGVAVGAVHVSPPASSWNMAEAQKKLAPQGMECAWAISRSIAH